MTLQDSLPIGPAPRNVSVVVARGGSKGRFCTGQERLGSTFREGSFADGQRSLAVGDTVLGRFCTGQETRSLQSAKREGSFGDCARGIASSRDVRPRGAHVRPTG